MRRTARGERHPADQPRAGGGRPADLRAIRLRHRDVDDRPPAQRGRREAAAWTWMGAVGYPRDAPPGSSIVARSSGTGARRSFRAARRNSANARVGVDHVFRPPSCGSFSEDLWQRVKARLDARAALFLAVRRRGSSLDGPGYQDESAYLLVGFVGAAYAAGPLARTSRAHGSTVAPARPALRLPGQAPPRERRSAPTAVALRQDILDRAILGAIARCSGPEVLELARREGARPAVLRALPPRRQASRSSGSWRRFSRSSTGWSTRWRTAPCPPTRSRPLGAEKGRKTALQAELTSSSGSAKVASSTSGQTSESTPRARVSDVATLLSRHTAQARQMLQEAPRRQDRAGAGGIEDASAGTRFRGALSIERLIGARRFKHARLWWPQRDSNPCLSRDHVFANAIPYLYSSMPATRGRD